MSRDTWKEIAIIGVIGMGIWFLIGKTQENMVSGVTSGIGAAWQNLWGGSDEPVRNYDSHGCLEGVTSWCKSLAHCVPLGLTCPATLTPDPVVRPTTDPKECSLGMSWCEKQERCVADYLTTQDYCDPSYVAPWEQPVEDPGWVPGLVDVCTWPNGDPLTVPVGMDCSEAVDDMCYRFRSIPGYKGCP